MKLFSTAKPAVFVSAALLVSGCANIKEDQARTKAEGAATGGAGGAVLGGLIAGLTSGGDPGAILRGAAIGGVAGGGIGYAYGASVASKKARYASTEAYLDACIAEVKSETAKLNRWNARGRAVVASQERQLAALAKTGRLQRRDDPVVSDLRGRIERSTAAFTPGVRHWQDIIAVHKEVVARHARQPTTEALKAEVRALAEQQLDTQRIQARFSTLNQQMQ
jgi:hypothetical protein